MRCPSLGAGTMQLQGHPLPPGAGWTTDHRGTGTETRRIAERTYRCTICHYEEQQERESRR